MGGLAGAAGARRLNEPRWLTGGDADLAIAGGAPTVWLVSIDDPAVRARAETVAASASELAEAARHTDAGERLVRRALARLMLAAAGDCRPDAVVIGREADGAPVVAAPAGWHLSLAARWPRCVIGVARRPIGVDVEAVGEALPDDMLTAAEQAAMGPSPPADRPRAGAALWAAKEAHAKWTGHPGLLDPADIDAADPHLVTSRFGATRCWRRHIGEHVAAVCTA